MWVGEESVAGWRNRKEIVDTNWTRKAEDKQTWKEKW